MPKPLVGKIVDQAVDFRLGADVDAARRLVQDQHLGLARPASAPARPSADCRRRACRPPGRAKACAPAACSTKPVTTVRSRPAAHKVEAAEAAQNRQRRVFEHAADQHQPFALAIFGRKADALGDGVVRAADGDSCPSSTMRPLFLGSSPKITLASSVRPAPTRPGKADDLAGVDMRS